MRLRRELNPKHEPTRQAPLRRIPPIFRSLLELAYVVSTMRGRIIELSPDEVRILSDDGKSEMAFRLANALEFGYGDPRDYPEDAAHYESCLVAFLAPIPQSGKSDMLTFYECKEQTTS